jgi:hypothetical protein
MTIEDLEQGMKLLWDEHVYSAGRLDRIEKIQETTSQELASMSQAIANTNETMAVMKDAELALMRTTTTLAHAVNDLAEAQKRTEATVAVLAEDLRILTRRVDSFIAAVGNGRSTQE